MTRDDAIANLLVRAHHAARPKRFTVSVTTSEGQHHDFTQLGGSTCDAAQLGMEVGGLGSVVRILETELGAT